MGRAASLETPRCSIILVLARSGSVSHCGMGSIGSKLRAMAKLARVSRNLCANAAKGPDRGFAPLFRPRVRSLGGPAMLRTSLVSAGRSIAPGPAEGAAANVDFLRDGEAMTRRQANADEAASIARTEGVLEFGRQRVGDAEDFFDRADARM